MRSTIVAVLSLFIATAVLAYEPPDAPKNLPDTGGAPRAYYAHSYIPQSPKLAGLDDRLSVHVQNFSTLLKQANGNCSGIVLFLDGMAIKGDKPESCDPSLGHVRFRLLRAKDDDTAWHTLLGSPQAYKRTVDVSVGSDPQIPIPTSATIDLEVIPRTHLFIVIGLIALALGIFIHLCRKTSLIRSSSTLPPKERPYSLSLFQMSFWFFLVIAAYVFVWLITDELDTITDSVLALIGIGAGTALGAVLIDKNKAAQTSEALSQKSQGLFHDVVSDATGVSLHRLQMFVWTLVLGVIFVGSVYKNLAMPEFSVTLLGLMGISSGTYLGFKVPEKQATDPVPGGTTPPQPPAKPGN